MHILNGFTLISKKDLLSKWVNQPNLPNLEANWAHCTSSADLENNALQKGPLPKTPIAPKTAPNAWLLEYRHGGRLINDVQTVYCTTSMSVFYTSIIRTYLLTRFLERHIPMGSKGCMVRLSQRRELYVGGRT